MIALLLENLRRRWREWWPDEEPRTIGEQLEVLAARQRVIEAARNDPTLNGTLRMYLEDKAEREERTRRPPGYQDLG